MIVSKEQKIKDRIEYCESIKGVKLTEEEIDLIKKEFENPIAHDIELRDGEIDLRKLSNKDLMQLLIRSMNDIKQQLTFLNQITNDVVLANYALIKLQGKDPFKEVSDIVESGVSKLKELK